MEFYLEGNEPTEEQLIAAIRRATLAAKLTPVLAGSAFKNKGVQPMLDAVVRFLPSPLDVDAIAGHDVGDESVTIERKPSENEPFSALAFKIMSDPHLGKLTYIRLYSGTLETGTSVLNSTKGRKERIGKIFQMHANKREEKPTAVAGMIVAVMGLKDTTTGDTLCDNAKPVILESMTFPAPVISVAIEPKSQGRPGEARYRHPAACRRRPRPSRCALTKRPVRRSSRGMGELAPRGARRPHEARVPSRGQRRASASRLPRDDHRQGRPRRLHAQEADRWVWPVRQGADRLEPLGAGGEAGYEFVNNDHRWTHPARVHPERRFWCSRGHGVRRARRLPDGRREGDAQRRCLPRRRLLRAGLQDRRIDGVQGRRKARQAGAARTDDVGRGHTPEDFMGDVIGDLNSRRGHILSMDERSGSRVVTAHVPLSEMFGYVGDLRSKTQGRASYSMQFDSYAQVPSNVATEIIAKALEAR